MNILVPMAGPDDSFRDRGFLHCKSLIEIAGMPMIQRVLENLAVIQRQQMIFVIRKDEDERFYLTDVVRLLDPHCVVLRAEALTAGAACTALLATEQINTDEELLITNADQFFDCKLEDVVADFRNRHLDGGTIVFDSVHPRWSYVRVNKDGLVIEASEKRPISRLATAGFYYFRRGMDFVSAAMEMIKKDSHVNGGFYVCPAFNEMILKEARIGIYQIDKSAYISLALPDDVEAYTERLRRVANKESAANASGTA